MKLADSITADILQEIKNQNYVPGDKIPNEFELAEKYQVSRTTIREAIKQLCSRNVLEIRRGNGTYVCKKLGRVTDPLGFEFTKDNAKLVKDLCEFRLITEPSFAYYAAERRTDDEAAAIIDVCTIIEDLIKNKDNYEKEDARFHHLIAKASHNEVITKVNDIINDGVRLSISISNPEIETTTLRTHRAIAEAILHKDENSAKEAMHEHIYSNYKVALRFQEDITT